MLIYVFKARVVKSSTRYNIPTKGISGEAQEAPRKKINVIAIEESN